MGFYYQRGEAENQFKTIQLELFERRMNSHEFQAIQMRINFVAMAYILATEFHCNFLTGTQFARSTVETFRMYLLEVAAEIRTSRRRIMVELFAAYPLNMQFWDALKRL